MVRENQGEHVFSRLARQEPTQTETKAITVNERENDI